MRLQWVALALASAMTGFVFADDLPPAQEGPEAQELEEKASYGLGFQVGSNIAETVRKQSIPVQIEALLKGLRDALDGKPPAYTEEELLNAMNEHRRTAVTRVAKKNKEEGEAFLKANGQKEGVKTLKSGLQYTVLQKGDGPSPGPTDRVRTHYHGTLIDGTVFDSSVERDEPIVFGVNEVIPGWTEALQLMKVGDKWRIVVPSKLAYGVNGAGTDIGPNAVLVFEVELIAIEP